MSYVFLAVAILAEVIATSVIAKQVPVSTIKNKAARFNRPAHITVIE